MDQLAIFKNIEKEDIDNMLKCFNAKIKTFKKKETILTYIGNSSIIGIIVNGQAELIRYDYSGNTTIIEQLNPSDIFGEKFSGFKTDELLIKANIDTTVLFVDYYHVIKNCKYYNKFLENFFEILTNKIKTFNERAEILSKKTIREKLLTYFEINAKGGFKKIFTIPFTYTDLAAYLGIDRSAMQREIKNLKDEGFITTKGRKVTLNY